jgi:hypothetical protein
MTISLALTVGNSQFQKIELSENASLPAAFGITYLKASVRDFAVTIDVADLPTFPVTFISSLVPYIAKDGEVSVQIDNADQPSETKQDYSNVKTAFLLAGLTLTRETWGSDGHKSFVATLGEADITSKPVSLPKKKSSKFSNADADADDQILDEDALLESAGSLVPLPAAPANLPGSSSDDCSGRKACDNCSCGRADNEAAAARGEISKEEFEAAPTSACGSCGKGDAFRCAGCPYLGKPAFKAGEESKVMLETTDDFEF